MNKNLILFPIIIGGFLFISASVFNVGKEMRDIKKLDLSVKTQDMQPRATVKPDLNFGKFPLYFIANKGQVNKKAKYYAKASRYTLWLTGEGLVFDSVKKVKVEAETTHPASSGHPSQERNNQLPHLPYSPHSPYSPKFYRDVSRLVFLDANKNPGIVPVEEAKLRVNYFIGSDPSKWHCNVPTSKAVLYKELYKKIDLKVYGIEKQIEYDWIVKPGGNPGDIQFEYTNVNGTRLDEEGNLLIETDFGELIHKRPVSYQMRKAQSAERKAQSACPKERKYVDVTFKKIAENTYGFGVGEYDKLFELIIDPVVLVYSTYLGGDDTDEGYGIAVDNKGNAYVAGYTDSTDFPTLNQYQTDQVNVDAFVTKINTTRSGDLSLVYSTYFGGGSFDFGFGIAVDNNGIAYVTGGTGSTDFPALNQYQTYKGDLDAFVIKLDMTQTGTWSLIYSTYLGGGNADCGIGIAADSIGNAYVTGRTDSTDFPTLNQYQIEHGNQDAFVTKMDTTQNGASSLIYSTYLGGGGVDLGYSIAAESNGNSYVTGYTYSIDFPTLNQYQADPGDSTVDAFVTKIDTTQSGNSSLIYSTYLGGGSWDYGWGIAVDSSGNAYVTGQTSSTDFPTLNQYQLDQGGIDAFVTKIDTTKSGASSLIYSTYLGGGSDDRGWGISLDSSGNAYVTGEICSTDYPTLNQYQTYQGNTDAFVTKIDTTQTGASSLIYSTYLGGNWSDYGYGIAVDNIGNAYVTGYVCSTDFPTRNQYQTDQGLGDAFVTKLFYPNRPTVTTASVTSITTNSARCGGKVITDGGSEVTSRGVCWSNSANPTTVDSHTTNGTGTGAFTSLITGLTPNTTYYARAYATNLAGTAYGNEVMFTTTVPVPPHIELNRTQLNFGAVIGESRTSSQTFLISNSGGSSLNWTVSALEPWIKASPLNGTANMMVTVSVDVAGLVLGNYAGIIFITDPTADNSPSAVEIYLDVKNTSEELPPFGTFETPRPGSVVYSSIPVTGWVLDDVEVSYVKIYRNPVQGQEKGLIYIGDGVFVEGARPDVEQAYPQYPFNYRAGWGYMMLTNFLPNQGNGTFVITAVAKDSSGNEVTLGEKTIICDNANAVKPFGAIDTPFQGGDAAGAEFINFGWALTPQPNVIPKDGTTIKVWVDGVPLEGNPVYNWYRKDVAKLFPPYNNSGGAGGFYYLDTTLYTNGVHTIAWSVTDDAGNTDGIGSRYFNIMNVNNPAAASASSFNYVYTHQYRFSIEHLPAAASPVYLKKGYKASSPQNPCYPGSDGIITIEIKEGERIEIQSTSCRYYGGYMIVGDQLRPLPVGSLLDTQRGIFYWQVGVGFLGEYRLVFIEKSKNGEFKRKYLDVMIHPKY
jgi:hypothetical protein